LFENSQKTDFRGPEAEMLKFIEKKWKNLPISMSGPENSFSGLSHFI
jgi:hypothetical protein